MQAREILHVHFCGTVMSKSRVCAIYGEKLQLELRLLIKFFFISLALGFIGWFDHIDLDFFTFIARFVGHDSNEARKMSILDDLMAKRCLVLSLLEFY